jgi:hypothetical protein
MGEMHNTQKLSTKGDIGLLCTVITNLYLDGSRPSFLPDSRLPWTNWTGEKFVQYTLPTHIDRVILM